jgi:hypothetical protein
MVMQACRIFLPLSCVIICMLSLLFTVIAYGLLLVLLMNQLRRPISMTCRIGLGFGVQVRIWMLE